MNSLLNFFYRKLISSSNIIFFLNEITIKTIIYYYYMNSIHIKEQFLLKIRIQKTKLIQTNFLYLFDFNLNLYFYRIN